MNAERNELEDQLGPDHAPAGPEYWRSLEEHAQAPEVRGWLDHEFPILAGGRQPIDAQWRASRRQFLRLAAATMSLAGVAGLSGCRRPVDKVLPYNQKPEDVIPGQPLYYATTMVLAGTALGLLIETHEGRPTKVEGNPNHPLSLGSTHAWAQASVLDSFDPDRSRFVVHQGQPSTWEEFLTFLDGHVQTLRTTGGQGLAVLGEYDASPATRTLRDQLLQALPQATWHLDDLSAAAQQQPQFRLDRAEVILSLDCDLLNIEDAGVAYRKAFAGGRSDHGPHDGMNRLYVVEPCPTVTGMSADHRLRLPLGQMYAHVLELAAALGVEGLPASAASTWDSRWIDAVADDLQTHAQRCIVAAGQRLPRHVHEVVRRINQQLGNIGKTVIPPPNQPGMSSLQQLLQRLQAGKVTTLVLLGVNPFAAAPADVDISELIQNVATSIHLGLYRDETADSCQWHVPQAHYLESWGDAQIHDTLSPVQPVIEPLMGGRTALELVARLAGHATTDPYELVRESFREVTGTSDVQQRFRDYLHSGVAVVPTAGRESAAAAETSLPPVETAIASTGGEQYEVVFALDASVYDGRFANNGWLQECPDPLTKLTWDNAAILSPASAEALDVETGDVVKIDVGDRSIEIAAFVLPGCADGVVTLPVGYARSQAGALAAHAGVDVSPLRTSIGMHEAAGAKVTKTGQRLRLGTTQQHWSIRDHELVSDQVQKRSIIREITHEQFQKHPEIVQHMGIHVPTEESIYEVPSFSGRQQWAMSIDLTRCVGCNACVTACQSENNIPLVGRDEVIRGREMHWMRVDRYFAGPDPRGDVTISSQPMMCQQCEIAPCEQVCPVNATVHDEEGLNVMAYNRCIGTRYCANNCPYKVRRFNFYDYNKGTLRTSGDAAFDRDPEPDPLAGLSAPQVFQPPADELVQMQKNPDVTVRMRGVMEKCTFCVQRIQQAKIEMKVRGGQTDKSTHVPDGMIQTACQQVCPTEAIVFGDQSDPASRVAQLLKDPRAYRVIEQVGTRPRVSYLARVRNVNPRMPDVFVSPAATVTSEHGGGGQPHGELEQELHEET